jgi:LysM repeat protein
VGSNPTLSAMSAVSIVKTRVVLLLAIASLFSSACIVASDEPPRGTIVRLTTPTVPLAAATATSRPVAVVTPTVSAPGGNVSPTAATAGPTAAVAASPAATAAPGQASTGYTVQEGDTLFALSRRTGVPVAEIARANDIAPDSMLRIGQQLQLPAGSPSTGAPPQGTSIVVASPERGATVRSPVVIQGSASTFEGVVNIEVLDSAGALIATGSTIASQPETGRAGPYRAEIIVPGPAESRQITLRVFWRSPRDGTPMDEVRVPLTLVG